MTIDCRDMACPQPVLETKKGLEALGENGILTLVLNSVSSIENCSRFAASQGCSVTNEPQGDKETRLVIVKGYGCAIEAEPTAKTANKTIFIKSDKIGVGELGQKLIHGFLKTILEFESLPKNIVFVNEGVLVTTSPEYAQTAEALCELEKRGVTIRSCGLCLAHFGIDPESLKVGAIGNAYETMQMLLTTEVVSL